MNRLTDVHNVTFPIDHDISVVPILDLQDVACDRISRHRLDKVEFGLLEHYSVDTAILVNKVGHKIVDFGSTHFIPRGRVRNDIDYPALAQVRNASRVTNTHTWSSSGNTVWKQI